MVALFHVGSLVFLMRAIPTIDALPVGLGDAGKVLPSNTNDRDS